MMFSPVLLFILLTGSYLPRAAGWDNDWDGVLYRVCPSGQAVSQITSIHDNGKEDRLWRFSCKTFAASRRCRWSTYANSFDGYMNFRCPYNQVIAGASSYHSNSKEDRRWKFYCCSAPRFTTSNCRTTSWVNDYDRYLNWHAPGGNFLTGAISRHDNGKEDRRWSFRYCQGRTY
ncbi:hemagglutinin/amebocyte aggregation factor-like [Polymixia lowei]